MEPGCRTFLIAAVASLALALPARADLVSHWTFDGHFEDEGLGGNDGTFIGEDDPIFVDGYDGKPEGAASFDGIDDYVLVNHTSGLPLYLSPQFSVAMWVRGGIQNDKRVWSESSSTNNSALFNLGTERSGTTGQFDLFVRNANGVVSAPHMLSDGEPFDDEWHHIAWVDDNGVGTLYIDGAADGAVFDYGRPDLSAGDPGVTLDFTTIGGILRGAPCCLFFGAIDDVRIFDHALSAREVAEILDPGRECPADDAGDSHCNALEITGPDGDVQGVYTITVDSATDDSGDDLSYTFVADNGAGTVRRAGPQPENSTMFNLSAGMWTISVTVDDDPLCFDEAPDATCTEELEVLAVPRQMIGHWPLDGDLEDATGNGNDGEAFIGIEPVFIEDRNGEDPGAATFDGVQDLVVVRQNVGLPLYDNEAFSIAMWVRGGPQPDYRVWSEGSTANRSPLFNIGTERTGATGQVDIFIRDAGGALAMPHVLSQREAFDNTWHHIAWVDDNGNARLYIDGILDGTDFTYVRPPLELDTTTIGGILRNTPSHWFIGDIDDVRVYNYAISEEEIAELVAPGECPEEGDTHCDDILVEGAVDDAAGTWTFTALDAVDDSDDPIFYTWTATSEDGDVLTSGPSLENFVSFGLTGGTWTVSVTVDDSVFCDDVAADATCSVEVTVQGDPGEFLSHWPFDGDLADARAGNDGQVAGGDPFFVEGVDGTPDGALAFDGVDDLVQVIHAEQLPLYAHPVFSVAMWVKGMPQNDRRVWSESTDLNNAPLINIGTENTGTTGQVDIFIRDDTGRAVVGHRLSQGIAFDGEWHHIAWVDKLGRATLYIDGEPDPTDFNYVRPPMELTITTIGGILRGGPCCLFAGEIDDVRAYTFALSAEEVAELAGRDVPPSGFVRGDPNSDGQINITDGINILGFLFLGDAAPACMDSADVNDDGAIQLTDAVGIFNFLFLGFGPPSPPSPLSGQRYAASDCGEDPNDDALDCAVPGPPCAPEN